MTDISTDRSFPLKCSVKTVHPIWATVTGLARGRAIAIAPQTFAIFPFNLEDYCGPYVVGSEPAPGQPIWTDKRIANCTEAQNFFTEWAQRTFERKWTASPNRSPTYEVRP